MPLLQFMPQSQKSSIAPIEIAAVFRELLTKVPRDHVALLLLTGNGFWRNLRAFFLLTLSL